MLVDTAFAAVVGVVASDVLDASFAVVVEKIAVVFPYAVEAVGKIAVFPFAAVVGFDNNLVLRFLKHGYC